MSSQPSTEFSRQTSLLSALLLLFAWDACGQEGPKAFPLGNELFHRLLADPRQAQTSLRYYRLEGQDVGDVALGNTWGMRRWHLGKDGQWAVQSDVEGMGYSRFRLSGSINEFQTIDFFANLPVEIRRGGASGRLTLFHESSHLGDDYFRRTKDAGFRYSIEGVRGVLSFEPFDIARFYGGSSYLLHAIPSLRRGTFQAGLELKTPDLRWMQYPCWLYLAEDLQSKEQAQWNLSSNTELGFRIAFPGTPRSLRIHGGYFTGHSEFGQFLARKENFFNLGTSFDF